MKIQKYTKDKQNKYKVRIDDEDYVLYDDVIIKYNLLMTKEIDKTVFLEMLKYNEELTSYYESIKYINRKLRSEKEVIMYLEKKGIDKKIITKTINKLIETKYLNDDLYFKAYFNDQINLSNNGPKKIKLNLLKLGFKESDIDKRIMDYPEDIWLTKIEKYIEKKIKNNHNASDAMLKRKVLTDLINLGYEKEMIESVLNSYKIDDKDILKKEYLKAKMKYEKKYNGYELTQKIREYLYRKGFYSFNLEELENEE